MRTLVITGPTCSGKGAVAHALAQRLAAEIVSLDSMKVYRHLSIGTAKPPEDWRRAVPYHLIDIVDPTEEWSTGQFVRAALDRLADIHARGRLGIVVGGTPLYLWGLVRGFCPAPRSDPGVRAALAERADREGLAALHEELSRIDPAAARRIHPNDRRRITRALEVHIQTGKPFTEFWQESVLRMAPGTYRMAGIAWPRDQLYDRIDRRVLCMVEAGLLAEADGVRARFSPLSATVRQCIGYREIWDGRDRGATEAAIVAQIQLHTRHFARKQGTWFKRFPEIGWFPAAGKTVEEVVDAVERFAA
jgi:tRNA dimethylallyltransferase